MSIKDFAKILLCQYGFDYNIQIDQSTTDEGMIWYEIHAMDFSTKEEIFVDGLVSDIPYFILSYMEEHKKKLCPWYIGISVALMMNDERRNQFAIDRFKHQLRIEAQSEARKGLEKFIKPCIECQDRIKIDIPCVENCEHFYYNNCDKYSKYIKEYYDELLKNQPIVEEIYKNKLKENGIDTNEE